MFCGISYRRLADALDGGVTSLATRHAIEALHALATHLPTSRDLILATGAVAKLVTLLRDSYAQAHYTMLKVDTLPHGWDHEAADYLYISRPALQGSSKHL